MLVCLIVIAVLVGIGVGLIARLVNFVFQVLTYDVMEAEKDAVEDNGSLHSDKVD